jgi:hypothetical protein
MLSEKYSGCVVRQKIERIDGVIIIGVRGIIHIFI